MTATTDFYQAHLDRVSRSFAFCIGQLRSPLREWVGLSYLLCRVVDTIEDAEWAEVTGQTAAFDAFDDALRSPGGVARARDFAKRFAGGVTEDEKHLLADFERLARDFHNLPPAPRTILHDSILAMSLGMRRFARTKPLVLSSLREVNQYCFFVAGVVGEMLARAFALVEPAAPADPARVLLAHHFGQFLQKVNVLKDQPEDQRRGRDLVPDRAAVEQSVWLNAAAALDFIIGIPPAQFEFRRFCAWSFFMGLETLAVSRNSKEDGPVMSIPRERNVVLLGEVENALPSDHDLKTLYRQSLRRLGVTPSAGERPHQDPPAWLAEIYHGALGPADLSQLGV